jgi:hypothetical protein
MWFSNFKRSWSCSIVVAVASLWGAPIVGAQTYTVLHAFSGPDGSKPAGGLIQGSDGNFYGMTT